MYAIRSYYADQAHTIKHSIDLGQWMIESEHSRMYADLDLIAIAFANRQQFKLVTELAGELDVESGNPGDPFGVNRLKIDPRAETK